VARARVTRFVEGKYFDFDDVRKRLLAVSRHAPESEAGQKELLQNCAQKLRFRNEVSNSSKLPDVLHRYPLYTSGLNSCGSFLSSGRSARPRFSISSLRALCRSCSTLRAEMRRMVRKNTKVANTQIVFSEFISVGCNFYRWKLGRRIRTKVYYIPIMRSFKGNK